VQRKKVWQFKAINLIQGNLIIITSKIVTLLMALTMCKTESTRPLAREGTRQKQKKKQLSDRNLQKGKEYLVTIPEWARHQDILAD
jgi:hypothetical protein